VIEEERRRARHGHFNIIHGASALRADLYLAGDDSLHEWALTRRRNEAIAGQHLWFAPIEYVIVRKLEYFRESQSDRHLRDIAGVLRFSRELIDLPTLERFVDERGLGAAWERAQRFPERA
jgi:hypothetical protein